LTTDRTLAIGPFRLASRALLAPMAGVTDRPFRALCRRFGAALAASEMLSSDVRLWSTAKSRRRLDHEGEPRPRVVQLAGFEPATMAEAARRCVDAGADIVDVNMGCPAKKVCNRLAGSALLRDEPLVARILESIVRAIDAPVTLKTRTGWDPANRNGPRIARIAEQCGVRAIAIHGRTRADMFRGAAEYDTIREIKAAVRIPVIANGDIDSGTRARAVLEATGCDGVMIGRAAQGSPWIFEEVNYFLAHGENSGELPVARVRDIMRAHLEDLYAFYGDETGVRMARKHLSWYCRRQAADGDERARVMREETAQGQMAAALTLFERTPVARHERT
jgi:tRNA-dihydrouridine synthase B